MRASAASWKLDLKTPGLISINLMKNIGVIYLVIGDKVPNTLSLESNYQARNKNRFQQDRLDGSLYGLFPAGLRRVITASFFSTFSHAFFPGDD